MISLAALASPAIVFVALSGRSAAVVDNTPLVARNIPELGTVLVGEHTLRLTAAPATASVQIALYREPVAEAPLTLRLMDEGKRTPGPDVLVYWQRSLAPSQLAGDAVLLGPYLAGRENRFALPVNEAAGSVVFYSLAHNKVLGTFSLTQIGGES